MQKSELLSNAIRRRNALRSAILIVVGISIFAGAIFESRTTYAANFTSTQSGSWNNPATWGGGGFPGCGDDVTIANGHIVTLDFDRCANNLTINPGGTLDMAQGGFSRQLTLGTNGTSFINNGTLTNSGGFNIVNFTSASPSAVTISGNGTYSASTRLQINNQVTATVPGGTTFTYNSAGNSENILVNGGGALNAAGNLNVVAPAAGANYVIVRNNGTFSGGTLRTQGNVRIMGNSVIASNVEIVSGSARADGSGSGDWTIDTGASIIMADATLTLSGNVTIQNGATLDVGLGGFSRNLDITGTGKTFTNNGTIANSGFGQRVFFFTGSPATSTITGNGTYAANVQMRIGSQMTATVPANTTFTFNGAANSENILVDGGGTLNATGNLNIVAPSAGTDYVRVVNNGTMTGGTLRTQGNVRIMGNSVIASNVEIVSGSARADGSGSGDWTIDTGASIIMADATLTLSGNVTIQNGATLDVGLGGFSRNLDITGTGKTFTNNGTIANSGFGQRAFFFTGSPATATIAGTGTYAGNVQILIGNQMTASIAPGATFTFSSATDSENIAVNPGGTLDVTNPLHVFAPMAGVPYLRLRNDGAISGAGGIRSNGNVWIRANSNIAAPVGFVAGAGRAQGNGSGDWTISSGASVTLPEATLTLSGNVSINSGATLDLGLNGFSRNLDITGNGKTFTNNGSVINSGFFQRILFNGGAGSTAAIAGTGTYSGNMRLEFSNGTTATVASGTTMTFNNPTGNDNILVNGGAAFNFLGMGSLTLSGGVTNHGTMMMRGGTAVCGDIMIPIRSSLTGTQRNWGGNGTFSMSDLDVRDQAGTAPIAVTGGVNTGNNGANWTFTPCATPTPTATPTSTPTNTPTATPTATPTNTPTATPTNTPTATPTNTPTATPTSTPTATPTSTPTATPTPEAGFECDVSPRPNGNGLVVATDVIQLRRFSTGLDTPDVGSEYQRADGAPRGTLGDGIVNAGDVIQARRYSTGLDPLTAQGGPSGPPVVIGNPISDLLGDIYGYFFGRELRVGEAISRTEKTVTVPIEMTPFGDEVAISFTLEYDAAVLGNPRLELGESAPAGSVLTINTNEKGRIGILIDSTEAMTASAVPKRVVMVTFEVIGDAGGDTRIVLTDSLAAKGISDSAGNTLSTRYIDRMISTETMGKRR